MPLESHLSDALVETVRSFPYNSFGKILLAEGMNYPANLGGNCVMQSRDLTRRIRERINGAPISYITATERPHWVVIVENEGVQRYMLDPFLMHTYPIDMIRAEAEYGSFPKWVDMVVTWQNEVWDFRTRLITKHKDSDLPRQVFQYTYDLSKWFEAELPPDSYQLLANLKQKLLELWCLTNQGNVIRIYCDPQTWLLTSVKIGSEKWHFVRSNNIFTWHMEEVADAVSVSSRIILQTIDQARRIYLKKNS